MKRSSDSVDQSEKIKLNKTWDLSTFSQPKLQLAEKHPHPLFDYMINLNKLYRLDEMNEVT